MPRGLSLREEAVQAHERESAEREARRERRQDELKAKASTAFQRAFGREGEPEIVADDEDQEFAEFTVDDIELRFARGKVDRHGRRQVGFFAMETCEKCATRSQAHYVDSLADLGRYLEEGSDFECPECESDDDQLGNGNGRGLLQRLKLKVHS